MGNKFSIQSTSSHRSSSSSSSNKSRTTRERSLSAAHIPKHLKPANKQQRQRLEKQHQQLYQQRRKETNEVIGIALPYHPEGDQGFKYTLRKNSLKPILKSPPPPFDIIQNGSQVTLQQTPIPITHNEKQNDMTTSITKNEGAKTAFQWFEGRRYQNQEDLRLPNDQKELDRLRVLNYILRWAFEGDIVAPVKKSLLDGTHVLNVGCGPGIWLGHPIIDFALDYTNSHFTAIDILDLLPDGDIYCSHDKSSVSPKVPRIAFQQINQSYFNFSPLHPNLPRDMSCSTWHQQYQQRQQQLNTDATGMPNDDSSIDLAGPTTSTSSFSGCDSSSSNASSLSKPLPTRNVFDNLDIYALDVREHGLPFPDSSFEFVMQRLSTPAYTSRQWKYVVDEIIRVTQPGGYIQFIEIDYNSQNLGASGQAWQEKVCEAMMKGKQLDPFIASRIDSVLVENGLVNVEKKMISMPFGSWGLDIGVLWQQNLEAFIEASAPAVGQVLGISATECKAMWQGYKDELEHVKAFTNVYAVWGQKPVLR